jgi:hypothetical protein
MSATTATLRGRQAAETLMTDTCTVQRATGTSTNDTTGVVTPTYSTIYTGKCKLQRPAGGARHDEAEASVVVAPLQLHLPIVGSEAVTVDDIATVTAAAMDSGLVGKVFRIDGPADASLKTARRLPVIEVTS